MDEMPKIEVQEIGHLGLISAVVKKFKMLVSSRMARHKELSTVEKKLKKKKLI